MSLMLHQKLNETKRISFDFDGVLLPKFLGKTWRNAAIKEHSSFEYIIDYIVSLMRPPSSSVKPVLDLLKNKGIELYLLTGRDPKAFIMAQKWLVQFGLDTYFTDKFHPDSVTLDPDSFKSDIIKFHHIDMHVDDSDELLSHLALDMPDRNFVLLGKSKAFYKPNVYAFENWAKFLEEIKKPN